MIITETALWMDLWRVFVSVIVGFLLSVGMCYAIIAFCQRGHVSGMESIDGLQSFYEYSTKCVTEQEKAPLFSFKDLTRLLCPIV